MSVLPKALLIGVGALVLSTLSIKAVDEFGIQGAALTGSLSSNERMCALGSVLVSLGERSICVDAYEAAPSSACPYDKLTSSRASEENLAQGSCKPANAVERMPWNYVSLTQAQQLCARAGKRLPTAGEWYAYSLGVQDEELCVLSSDGPESTGSSGCVNEAGVHDAIGNLWEWVAAEIHDGSFESRQLPASGYVSAVDLIGMPLETALEPSEAYGSDYVTTQTAGTYAVVRGGFYGSGSDGGLFSINAAVPHSLATQGIGFRCVQDVSG